MTYRLQGLAPAPFEALFGLPDAALAEHRALRVSASSSTGFPCRVSLEDARAGDALLLVNHVSLDGPTPFRASHAIYVRAGAARSPVYEDRLPEMLNRRTLSLRAFDAAGMLCAGTVAAPGEGDVKVRALLGDPDVVAVHAHNAAYGCFLATIERN